MLFNILILHILLKNIVSNQTDIFTSLLYIYTIHLSKVNLCKTLNKQLYCKSKYIFYII